MQLKQLYINLYVAELILRSLASKSLIITYVWPVKNDSIEMSYEIWILNFLQIGKIMLESIGSHIYVWAR